MAQLNKGIFKQCILFACALLAGAAAFAQGPVTWTHSARKVSDKVYEVRLTAQVDEQWHIYSQQSPRGGPLPTNISFVKNPLLVLDGKTDEEGELEIYHEEVFGVDVYAYTGKVDFVQKVKLKANAKTNLSVSVEFMACTNTQCLPPATLHFTIALDK